MEPVFTRRSARLQDKSFEVEIPDEDDSHLAPTDFKSNTNTLAQPTQLGPKLVPPPKTLSVLTDSHTLDDGVGSAL